MRSFRHGKLGFTLKTIQAVVERIKIIFLIIPMFI